MNALKEILDAAITRATKNKKRGRENNLRRSDKDNELLNFSALEFNNKSDIYTSQTLAGGPGTRQAGRRRWCGHGPAGTSPDL